MIHQRATRWVRVLGLEPYQWLVPDLRLEESHQGVECRRGIDPVSAQRPNGNAQCKHSAVVPGGACHPHSGLDELNAHRSCKQCAWQFAVPKSPRCSTQPREQPCKQTVEEQEIAEQA